MLSAKCQQSANLVYSFIPSLQHQNAWGRAQGAAELSGAELTHPSRTRVDTALHLDEDFSGWASLQAYLLPWASYLTSALWAQIKSKAVVVLFSNCASWPFLNISKARDFSSLELVPAMI